MPVIVLHCKYFALFHDKLLCLGGSLVPGADVPTAEALVGWLLEHQDIQIPGLSDSDSLSDLFSDSDSISDYSDFDGGSLTDTQVRRGLICFMFEKIINSCIRLDKLVRMIPEILNKIVVRNSTKLSQVFAVF